MRLLACSLARCALDKHIYREISEVQQQHPDCRRGGKLERRMKAEDSIEISAPLSRVWEATIDVEHWPQSSPTFQDVKRCGDDKNGPFQLKSQAKILQPGMPWTTWTVTDFEEKKRFAWEANALYGLLPMKATHELTCITETTTRNVLRVETQGMVATLLTPFIAGSIQGAIEMENKGLKAFCEESITATR